MSNKLIEFQVIPDITLMNGKGPYGHDLTRVHESFTVIKCTPKKKTDAVHVDIFNITTRAVAPCLVHKYYVLNF